MESRGRWLLEDGAPVLRLSLRVLVTHLQKSNRPPAAPQLLIGLGPPHMRICSDQGRLRLLAKVARAQRYRQRAFVNVSRKRVSGIKAERRPPATGSAVSALCPCSVFRKPLVSSHGGLHGIETTTQPLLVQSCFVPTPPHRTHARTHTPRPHTDRWRWHSLRSPSAISPSLPAA